MNSNLLWSLIGVLGISILCLVVGLKFSFRRWFEAGTKKILTNAPSLPSSAQIDLPPILRNYLHLVGLKRVDPSFHCIQFRQTGQFRMKPTDPMSEFTANQMVSLNSPMFSWVANLKLGGIPVAVCDRLIDGKGELQARLLGAIPVAKASGPELLHGELLRYLAELPWYPEAILRQPAIQWRSQSNEKAEARIDLGGTTAAVEYTFKQGLIRSIFVSERGRIADSKIIPTPWLGEFADYEEHEGILIPSKGEVSWLLPEGKFTYFKGRIVPGSRTAI